MHIWTLDTWQNKYGKNEKTTRAGLRFVFEKEVDIEIKRCCKEFGVWLRKNYYFPIRIPVYVKTKERIKCTDGDFVVGLFFEPNNIYDEPYVKIATGDYSKMVDNIGKDNALAAIINST